MRDTDNQVAPARPARRPFGTIWPDATPFPNDFTSHLQLQQRLIDFWRGKEHRNPLNLLRHKLVVIPINIRNEFNSADLFQHIRHFSYVGLSLSSIGFLYALGLSNILGGIVKAHIASVHGGKKWSIHNRMLITQPTFTYPLVRK